jgi:hypothetical protein
MGRYDIILGKSISSSVEEKKKILSLPEKSDRFRGKKGEEYRIGFMSNDVSKDAFMGAKVHFYNQYFRCRSHATKNVEICCSANYQGKTPKWRFSAVIVVYPDIRWRGTFRRSKILPEVKLWTFGEAIYRDLSQLGRRNPLTNDLILTCENQEFQKWNMRLCRTSMWKDAVCSEFLKKEAQLLLDQRKKMLGADLSLKEIESMFIENGIQF